MDLIPLEILIKIFGYLNNKELATSLKVCSKWKAAIDIHICGDENAEKTADKLNKLDSEELFYAVMASPNTAALVEIYIFSHDSKILARRVRYNKK